MKTRCNHRCRSGGLFLATMLHAPGHESVVLESRSRAYVEERVRDRRTRSGPSNDEPARPGRRHDARGGVVDKGLEHAVPGPHHPPRSAGADGRNVQIYGQQEVVKDLIAARMADGDPLLFEAEVTRLEGMDGDTPRLHFRHDGVDRSWTASSLPAATASTAFLPRCSACRG